MAAERSWITMHGGVYDKEKLKELFRSNDLFAMISHSETFGLVYVEALSQGLPVVFTKNQGIDGFFSENIGVAVNSDSAENVATSIAQLFEEYAEVQKSVVNLDLSRFQWSAIAQQYLSLFKPKI